MNLTATDLCNMALGQFGAKRITDYDDDSDRTKEAVYCRMYLPQVRFAIFRSHPWNCISIPAALAASGVPSAWEEYDHVFELPSDCVRVIRLDWLKAKWHIYGRRLYTQYQDPVAEYVRLETDCTKYDGLLVEVLTDALAAKLVWPLSGDGDQVARVMETFKTIWEPLARFVDGAESSGQIQDVSNITDMFT